MVDQFLKSLLSLSIVRSCKSGQEYQEPRKLHLNGFSIASVRYKRAGEERALYTSSLLSSRRGANHDQGVNAGCVDPYWIHIQASLLSLRFAESKSRSKGGGVSCAGRKYDGIENWQPNPCIYATSERPKFRKW